MNLRFDSDILVIGVIVLLYFIKILSGSRINNLFILGYLFILVLSVLNCSS
jgi:hypothetical protein